MLLFTKEQERRLLMQGLARSDKSWPVVKWFTPDAGATWLVSEIDPSDTNRAFGIADLGLGFVELGWIPITEIRALRGPRGLSVERDRWFTPTKSLLEYLAEAKDKGRLYV